MSSLQRLVITSNQTALDFISQCNLKPLGLPAINSMVDYFAGLAGGNVAGASLAWKVGCVQATATIVSAAAAVNAETMSLLNVTLTAITGPGPAANEFVLSATPATQAANIAAAINASASFTGKVTAVVTTGGTVTVTSVVPGLIGNGLQISESMTGVTVTQFTGGTDGTAYNINAA